MNAYRIAEARKAQGISQQELAEALNSSQKQIHLYESGKRDPKAETVIRIAQYLNTTVSYLLGLEKQQSQDNTAPVYAHLIETRKEEVESADRYQEVTTTLYKAHKQAFWLVVRGNSMNRLFPDGSLVLIDPEVKVKNGEVGAIHLRDHEAILKRIYFEEDGVRLCPESYDDQYHDVFIRDVDDERRKLIIIGKVVSFTAPDGWRA